MKPPTTTPTPADAPAAGLRLRPLALGFLAMVALSLVALSREFSATATLRAQDTAPAYVADGPLSGGQYVHYPEEMFATDWAARVPLSDRLDLGRLHKACMRFKDSIIPWNIGGGRIPHERAVINESDPNLLTRLKQCADVDIFVPGGLRNNGYCEDAAAYTKYLHARMLPYWAKTVRVFDPAVGREVGYHDLCPTTPMVFFNHYWEDMPDDPSWPREKHMILMPNLEMHELQAEHYWRPDYVLCKTAVCTRYLKDWYKQHGNPRQTRVVYTRHTSTDVSSIVRAALPLDEIAPKNFAEPSIIHTAGTSIQKGSMHVFDCWLGRPDLPPIDMYMAQDLFDGWFKKKYSKRLEKATNVRLHLGKMDEVAFGHLIAESSIFVCSSLQEGYGHYINQARASGGLILTPDVPPMNELITPSSGVLMEARGVGNEHQFFGGNGKHPLALRNVTGFIARFGGDDVCEAVDLAMKQLTAEERQQRAERAQQQYFFDTVFFARAMEDLKRDLGVDSTVPRLRNTP